MLFLFKIASKGYLFITVDDLIMLLICFIIQFIVSLEVVFFFNFKGGITLGKLVIGGLGNL